MNITEQSIFEKYQLEIFFALSYVMSWWSAPLTNGRIIPHGPMLAAWVVLALIPGRSGIATWWRRNLRWQVGYIWYLIGPGIILVYHGIAIGIALLLGTTVSQLPAFLTIGGLFQLLLLGGQWEEPGWTGYALPKMYQRFTGHPNRILVAGFTLGIFRALWHLPLYLYGHIPWFDIVIFEVVHQLLTAWLYFQSGGSVPVVMVFHFASNIMGAVMAPVFSGTSRVTYYALFVLAASMMALALFKWFDPNKRIATDPVH